MRQQAAIQWSRRLMLGALVAVVLSCADSPTAPKVTRVTVAQLRAAVTDSVASLVDASGQFVFASVRPSERPEITEQRARALARALWKTREASYRRILPEDRDGVALAENLTVCPRVFYAETGYDPFPAELPVEIRRSRGNKWMVGLCNGPEQQVSIAVSAEATDLVILSSGMLAEINGGDFSALGVPVGTTIPAIPENGAVAVAAPGFRVSGLPVLRRRANHKSAALAEWVYPIENIGPVRGLATGIRRSIGSVRYGPYYRLGDARPIDENPEGVSFPRNETLTAQITETQQLTWTIRRRADVPYKGEPIVREPQ